MLPIQIERKRKKEKKAQYSAVYDHLIGDFSKHRHVDFHCNLESNHHLEKSDQKIQYSSRNSEIEALFMRFVFFVFLINFCK
jgi:hypothetical protein